MNKKITGLEKAIIGIGKRIYKRGYVASNDGNISARIDKNYILIKLFFDIVVLFKIISFY